jgi:hypothetical protein
MELGTTRAATSYAATQELTSFFIESERSLPQSQELSTGLYHEPDHTIPSYLIAKNKLVTKYLTGPRTWKINREYCRKSKMPMNKSVRNM